MAETSVPRVLRTVLALLAAAALLGACSGDDKKDDAEKTSSDPRLEEPCQLVALEDLSRVTGITFDASEPSENSCTYTSSEGLSAMTLNFADLNGVKAQLALDQARTSCDEGSIRELDFTTADGGFACVVTGEGATTGLATLAISGDGLFAVLTGVPLNETIDNGPNLQALATMLEASLTK